VVAADANARVKASWRSLPGSAASACARTASAVLVAVDPSARLIEIVTGVNTRSSLDNRACEFAALSMKSCFVADDLVGGVREGVTMLAAHARHPRVLHLDEPA
jgi:hypothetical protein